jgi:tRNA-dihydrouridine synthase B
MKMYHFWEYFATTFDNPQKAVKLIKKAKNIQSYDAAVHSIFMNERTLALKNH